ncbi:choice-of-anchor M domain-containing protein [Conexibacter sp. JD483]|uniref:choice-of-anchor M domain-containing protein n=1 Tax=Conexibacter sp. JD483 TaxID=3064471 RepID=UPI002715FF7B|nr:choice-of-anchor M domain-containing protein [Conexibacter sp. JD483]MDO8196962.1 choice-of-anchor M domain-containing protein [Conexibacter sp. CPCC 205762]
MAAVVVSTLATASAARAEPVVLADGHVDYAARMVGGQLRNQIKDGTQGVDRVVWREPADVVFEVREAAKTTVPADARMRFLGAAGASTWTIPQVQRQGILWAGWNTEALTLADVGGPLTWTLQSAQGPGTVALFQSGPFGDPDIFFNSGDGLPDSRRIPLGTHAHGNWAFSAPGTYQLTFAMATTRPGGEPTSDTQTLTVNVDGPATRPTDPAPTPVQPGQQPTLPSSPSTPGGAPTGPVAPSGEPAVRALTLQVRRPRAVGRTLSFTALISRKSRLEVTVQRAGRVFTRGRARLVSASRRRVVRVRLGRSLAPGRVYKVTVRVRAGGRSATRTLVLRTRSAS